MSNPIYAAQATGTGCQVSIGGPTGASGTETFTLIAGISDAKFSGRKRATTPTTNFNSNGIAQKLGTVWDLGQFTCTVQRVSNDTGQLAVIAAAGSPANYDFKVQLPINTEAGQTTVGDLITFYGIVTEAGDFDISLSKVSEYTFTVDLNGYTLTAGS